MFVAAIPTHPSLINEEPTCGEAMEVLHFKGKFKKFYGTSPRSDDRPARLSVARFGVGSTDTRAGLLSKTWSSVAGSLNKRLMLSLSFRCDQIYKYEKYNFGHTLLRYLSPT